METGFYPLSLYGVFVHFFNTDLIKYFLLATSGIFVFIFVIMFVVLIVHKLHVESYQRQLNRLQEMYAKLLAEKLSAPDVVIEKPQKDVEYEALSNAIIDMMAIGNLASISLLRIISRSLELDLYNQKRVLSRSWVERYRAVEKLGFLKLPELGPLFCSILNNEKNILVRTKAIWSLSLVADVNVLDLINTFLVDPLSASSKFKEYIYSNIIKSFQEACNEDAFVHRLDQWEDNPQIPVLLKKDIISACGVAGLISAKESIKRYHKRFYDVPEMKIACIRALEKLGDSDMYEIIVSALHDEDWRVRAVAAKNAEVCSDKIVEALQSALRDKNYFVRINAAQALSKTGEKGKAVLTGLTMSDDNFARDMAHYMLSR